MADISFNSRHVSYEQVKIIIDFMGQHVDFARGCLRSIEARHTSKTLWNELTKILDKCRSGARKNSDGWSKYWSDFKNKLKNKVTILKKRKRSGSSCDTSIKPLTRLEKRALVILGPLFEKKLFKMSADPTNNSVHHLPKVKLEALYDNGHHDISENSDRQSESAGSSDLNESFGDSQSDGDSNEPIIQSIYPKWLIEVEKKRADADLTRAKAEEHRAKVAEKNAEAALIQAEALRKLADAALKQAEAVTKISTLLENRFSRDIMPM